MINDANYPPFFVGTLIIALCIRLWPSCTHPGLFLLTGSDSLWGGFRLPCPGFRGAVPLPPDSDCPQTGGDAVGLSRLPTLRRDVLDAILYTDTGVPANIRSLEYHRGDRLKS